MEESYSKVKNPRCANRGMKKQSRTGKRDKHPASLSTCLQHLPLGSPVAPSCQLRDLLIFSPEASQWLPITLNKTQLFSMAYQALNAWPCLLLLASAWLQAYHADLFPVSTGHILSYTRAVTHDVPLAWNNLLFALLMAVPFTFLCLVFISSGPSLTTL